MLSARERLDQIKKSPVTTELMPALIGAAKLATVKGYSPANAVTYGDNAIEGDLLFDTAIDGNNTTAELMNTVTDGLNLRIYRVDPARIKSLTQGLYPIEEIIPICFCPTFKYMKDTSAGQESIDDIRENLRLATIAIYSEKNFPTKNNVYRRTPPSEMALIPFAKQNFILNFEKKMSVDTGDNWYSAAFTIYFSVNIKNYI